MNKLSLRQHYLLKREELDPKILHLRSEQIKHQFLAYFNHIDINIIHTFLPITKKKEINTLSILDALRLKVPRLQVIVSRSNMKTCEMESYLLQEDTVLEVNKWGIPEPKGGVLFNEMNIDTVLIPLLVFDKAGHRIGYGKGFYDRFLKKLRPGVLKIGLSLEPPIPLIPDTNQFDVTLNYCVTPDKVYEFH